MTTSTEMQSQAWKAEPNQHIQTSILQESLWGSRGGAAFATASMTDMLQILGFDVSCTTLYPDVPMEPPMPFPVDLVDMRTSDLKLSNIELARLFSGEYHEVQTTFDPSYFVDIFDQQINRADIVFPNYWVAGIAACAARSRAREKKKHVPSMIYCNHSLFGRVDEAVAIAAQTPAPLNDALDMVSDPKYQYTFTDFKRAALQQRILSESDGVIVWTECEKTWMLKAYPDIPNLDERLHAVTIPMHYVPEHNLNLRHTLRSQLLGITDHNTQVFYSQGRMVDYKHPEMVVQGFADTWNALSHLQNRPPNIACAMIGDGPMQEQCKSLAQSFHPEIQQRIHFLGQQQAQVGHTIGDTFVFPSSRESFGMVGAEATMSGNTVIASDLGTIKEAVGEYGRYATNQVGFSKAMIDMALMRTQDRIRLGELLRQSSTRFTPTNTANDLAHLIANLHIEQETNHAFVIS